MASISQLGMLVQQLIHTKCPIFFEKWAYLISEKGYYFYLFYRDLVNCFQFAGRQDLYWLQVQAVDVILNIKKHEVQMCLLL